MSSQLIGACKALVINRYGSSFNRPPRLCFAKGAPPDSGGEWAFPQNDRWATGLLCTRSISKKILLYLNAGAKPAPAICV
jgi:hypothetical protein